jgi:hypothetical protein
MVQDSPRYTDEQKAVFFKLIDKEKIRADHFYNTGEELPDDMLEMLYQQGAGDFNQGGRVGMFAGGSLIGKGIMEAAKLANRGVKPFGAKQTYKQNVKNIGLSNFDQVELVTSKKIDELRNANDVDGLFEMLEDVVSGKKFGMANSTQRKVLQENIEEALNDIPLNRDSRERLAEDYFNMMEYYKPAPKETGKVIPFKPKTKKAGGGRIGFKDGKKVRKRLNYNSATGDYNVLGGVDIGPLDVSVSGSGNTGMNDPTMIYEAGLDLPNDFRLEGGYYDDAVMMPGMMSPDDELRLKLIKSFANGGTVPPLKGPASDGMGSLFRRK